MRKDLKKAKTMSDGYNSRSIFAGASYKNYDNNPQTNRPSHLNVDSKTLKTAESRNSERILLNLDERKDAEKSILKYMDLKQFKNSGIEKTWDSLDIGNMYRLNKEDLKENSIGDNVIL